MNRDTPSLKEKVRRSLKKKDNSIPKFLLKTYDMLEDGSYVEFVGWNSDGTSMMIKKPSEFAERVLPAFFKHNNLASFIRQLNMYNFKKKKNQEYDHVYSHELFRRGKKAQLSKILRKGAENALLARSETNEGETTHDESHEKPDLQQEISSLESENVDLKKHQEDMNGQLQTMENKITDLKNKNDMLIAQYKRQNATEEFLKKIINSMAMIYGASTIHNVIESVNKNRANGESCFTLDLKQLTVGNTSSLPNNTLTISKPDYQIKEFSAQPLTTEGDSSLKSEFPQVTNTLPDPTYMTHKEFMQHFSVKRFDSDFCRFEDRLEQTRQPNGISKTIAEHFSFPLGFSTSEENDLSTAMNINNKMMFNDE